MEKEEIKSLAVKLHQKLKENDLNGFKEILLSSLEKEKTKKLGIVKTPTLNSIGKELGKLLVKDEWKFERLLDCWKLSLKNARRDKYGVLTGREIKYVVINALGEVSKKEYQNARNFVLNILNDLQDWEMVDTLALRVIVNLAKQNQEEMFYLLKKWTKSNNKWVRRLSAASIPSFIRAKPIEAKICLKIIENLMEDEDLDVKKAVAWALREISKKDPKAVYEFLLNYTNTQNKDTKWIIKEGIKNYLRNGLKKLNYNKYELCFGRPCLSIRLTNTYFFSLYRNECYSNLFTLARLSSITIKFP
ncbi:MAG: DNA alkylation repair protein [Candidatus Baldrarchaeia archaeon]